MSRIILLAILILVGSYGLFRAWSLVRGPEIEISQYDIVGSSSIMSLSGIARNTQTLTLNGKVLLIDSAGNFATTLTLPLGGGILYINATDRFGRQTSLKQMFSVQ